MRERGGGGGGGREGEGRGEGRGSGGCQGVQCVQQRGLPATEVRGRGGEGWRQDVETAVETVSM